MAEQASRLRFWIEGSFLLELVSVGWDLQMDLRCAGEPGAEA